MEENKAGIETTYEVFVCLFFVGVFFVLFCFCHKVTGQGEKPMFLFPFLNFMLWKEVSTSTEVCMCMYVCQIY